MFNRKLILVLIVLILITCILFVFRIDQKSTTGLGKPEANRFTIEVLTEDVNQPMQMEILKDGRVLFVEKIGKVKVFDPSISQVKIIADIPVNVTYIEPNTTAGGMYDADDGLHGVLLDPDFEQNHYVYLYYSPAGGEPRSILARYEWEGDSLEMNSKKVLLEWRTQRNRCCHFGGGMVFDADGNLFLAIGDNTGLGNAPPDAPRKEVYDPQRTAGNTNDLRGSIIRIRPESDGTYLIPKGNLYLEGTPKARPEIYIMGVRNPWRLSIDSKTGWLYWGEVGPSTEEFNQARQAGNFGWPYFLADNEAYLDKDKSGAKFDSADLVNNSPNNSGLTDLQSPQPALVWYSRSQSDKFPIPGTGSLSAVGGPIYHVSNFDNPKRPFPKYYEGKWFVTDFVRGWMVVIEMDDDGNYKSMERFLPEITLKGPIDMDFGPEGDLYVMEYSRDPYVDNPPDAKLVRIKYNDGNRKPVVEASASRTAGSVPFSVQLSSVGTRDYDNDPLNYTWKIESQAGSSQIFTEPNPIVILNKPGIYEATLTVVDSERGKDSKTVKLTAGNEPPVVDIDFHGGNKSFYFPGHQINYSVEVRDKEDGRRANKIDASKVEIWSGYVLADYKVNVKEFTNTLRLLDTLLPVNSLLGLQYINKSDCRACHTLDKKSVGPSFLEIAKRYHGQPNVEDQLTKKIMSGGTGVWGSVEMPPHPSLRQEEATLMTNYILNLTNKGVGKALPLNGSFSPPSDKANGHLLFRAAYTDGGNNGIPPMKTVQIEVLRSPIIPISEVDILKNMIMQYPGYDEPYAIPQNSSYVGLHDVDLTGIKQIGFEISEISETSIGTQWEIAIKIDSLEGKLIGEILVEKDENYRWRETYIDSIIKDKHDIYFIFTNKKYSKTKNTVEIRSVRFSR